MKIKIDIHRYGYKYILIFGLILFSSLTAISKSDVIVFISNEVRVYRSIDKLDTGWRSIDSRIIVSGSRIYIEVGDNTNITLTCKSDVYKKETVEADSKYTVHENIIVCTDEENAVYTVRIISFINNNGETVSGKIQLVGDDGTIFFNIPARK